MSRDEEPREVDATPAPRKDREVILTGEWRIVLPPGWLTLPTEPEAAAKAIGRLLDSALKGKPRDEMIDVRIELDRALREQARQAAKAGARHVHSMVEPVRGMPVSASLISSRAESQDPERLAPVLHAMFGEAEGIVENGYADLADRGALRRVRRWAAPEEISSGPDAPPVTSVDYIVPLDDDDVLVMAFSTSSEPIHRELVVLFDAIATTLHRAPAPSGDAPDEPDD